MKNKILFLILAAFTAVSLAGCGSSSKSENTNNNDLVVSGDGFEVSITDSEDDAINNGEINITVQNNEPVNVALIKGPTAIGAVSLMKDSDDGKTEGNYKFILETAPDNVISKIISGEVDIAAVPSNSAAAIYNKTNGGVSVAAINTFGNLYILENGNTINSIEDLSQKTITSTGQGAVPEYVLNYVLNESKTQNVSINFMQTHPELATALASGEVDIALLPEPFVDVAMAKNPNLRVAIDIAQFYDNYSGIDKGDKPNTLPMGCIIVKNDFAQNNKEKLDLFIKEYKKSIDFVNNNTEQSAQYTSEYGIIENKEIAQKAIPKCSIYYVDGDDMKTTLESFFKIMYAANPKSIGGKMPENDFYYNS